jgi:hypothetical protein
MKSRKEKIIFKYISPQMSRYADILVKTSIQDKRVYVLKLELVETTSFLLKKEEMTLQVRREN